MSELKITIPKDSIEINENSLTFDFKGDPKYGLDKTIVNGIRRILLSSMPSVAFRLTGDNPDLKIVTNNTSLHNEYLLHRVALIPLYINPLEWHKDLLFKLSVKNTSNVLQQVSAKDIEIYPVKKSIISKCRKEDDYSILDTINIENYDLTKPLAEKDKKKIFRPFEIADITEYCLITELASNQSEDNISELELYGSPSISTANEDVRWQNVSCSTYSFKQDEKLFVKAAKEKMIVNNIDPSREGEFVRELNIEEGERYYHRDVNLQPFWYEFRIDSQGYFPPNMSDKGDGLLVQSTDLLVKIFEGLKSEFRKLLDPDSDSIMIIKKLDEGNDLVYKIIVTGGDDTIGSILQAHISNKLINSESILSLCGYKKLHPLEEVITFTLALNTNNRIVKLDNIQKVNAIVDQMVEACNQVSLIYQKINEECKKV